MKFKDLIKTGLRERSVSAADLSKLTGISQTSISYYIHGYSEPKPANKKKILDALGFDEETLEKKVDKKAEKRIKQLKERKLKNRMSVSEAAELMNVSPPVVYEGLKAGKFAFGTAVRIPESKEWTYIIWPKKFTEVTGIERET